MNLINNSFVIYCPFQKFSTIWRRHHCQFRPMFDASGHWAVKGLFSLAHMLSHGTIFVLNLASSVCISKFWPTLVMEMKSFKFHVLRQQEAEVWCKKSKIYVFVKKNSSLLFCMVQTNYVNSNDNKGRVNQNCKFHDPRGKGSWPCKGCSENAFLLKPST